MPSYVELGIASTVRLQLMQHPKVRLLSSMRIEARRASMRKGLGRERFPRLKSCKSSATAMGPLWLEGAS